MDDFKPELLKALLDWVNTFELPGRVTAWTQLEDGQILWQILNNVDPAYFNDSLPNLDEGTNRRHSITDLWIPKWQNLKHIERAVSTYLREECEKLPVLSKRMIPDLKTGARDGSMMLTAKLTMAVLVAALTSPKSGERMVTVMAGLGESANIIGGGIQELLELDRRMAELGVEKELTTEPSLPTGYRTPQRAVSGAGSVVGRDNDLEQEALLFEANKDRNALRNQVSKLQGDVEKSKVRISQLEEELVEARLHLDDRGVKGATSDEVERLRNDLLRERQYIDRLETDHANAKDVIESLKKRAARFEAEHEAKQELRDQLQLVRAERDELEMRAKANENLKKKIESLSKESKSLEVVRQELQQAKERLQDLEDIEEKCAALEKVNKENIQTLINSEQSIYEEKGKRNRLEHDNLMLMKELEQTKELQYKAEEAKRELEDRVRELEANSGRGDSLEDELGQDQTDNLEVPSSARISSDGRVSADAIALQQRVEVLSARLRSMETETLKQMQENLGLKSDILASKDEESQKPFLEQNQKLQTAETELQELQSRLRDKDLQIAELQNTLNKKSDVEDDVKNEALQAEHDRLLAQQEAANKRLRDLEVAKDEARSLLLRALLDRDHLSPELLQLQREETLKMIREQIEGVIKAPAESQPKVLDVTSNEIAETVGRSRAALETVKRDLEEQTRANEQLREQLEQAKRESAEKGSAELQAEVENLRRENKLITSAWYDMTSRLQSNTVLLQRKSEAPRSWMGKQREIVLGVGAPRR